MAWTSELFLFRPHLMLPALMVAASAGSSELGVNAAATNAFVWPAEEWAEATPESQGMSSASLDEAATHGLKYGGGSGCVIRDGYLVKEWGDPARPADIKSATKGSVGTTMLGVAFDDRLVQLDNDARKHYPRLGEERPENIKTGWLDEITVHHLATMTAGFDDGRPPTLVRRPGDGRRIEQ